MFCLVSHVYNLRRGCECHLSQAKPLAAPNFDVVMKPLFAKEAARQTDIQTIYSR